MWEIFTYGGGDFLRLIFNAVAMIFGSDDYYTALKISGILGLLAVMIMGAFRKGELNVQWILAVVLIFQGALVPKVNVIITDEIVPANSAVVANVPVGLAATATLFSKFSHWATETSEVVFALPNQIGFRGNGLLFANTLVEEASRFEFTSPQVASNYSEFWKSCVYYDLLLGLYSWDQLVKSGNIVSFLGANTSVTRSFTYTDAAGNRSVINCRTGFNNELTNDLNAEIVDSTNIYGARLAPNEVDNNAAVAKFAASLPVAFQYMTGMAQTNAEIIGRNALANSLKRGLISFASEADAPAAAQDFALARAEQERRSTFSTLGHVAKKMLPILQHLFEAFAYAAFPFIMLVAVTPLVAKVAMGYVKVLFWISLWPPLYAILHFAITYYSASAASVAMITQGAGFSTGLSVMTNTGLGNVMEDYAAIAGYLSLSIPMIAWMFVQMSGAMAAGLAGRLMQGYEQPVSKATEEATSGNMRLGDTRYMNTSAFQHNTSPTVDSGMIQERLGSGSMMTTTAAGRYLDQHTSSGGTSIDVAKSLVNSTQQQLSNATARAEQESFQMTQSNMAALRDANSVMSQTSRTDGSQSGISQSESNMSSYQQSQIDSAMNNWAKANNITLTDELKGAIYSSIEGGVGLKILGNGGGVTAGASAQGSTSEADSAIWSQANSFTSSEQFTSATSNIAQTARTAAVTSGVSESDSSIKSLDASLTKQQAETNSYTQSLSQVRSATEAHTNAVQFMDTYKQSGIDQLRMYALNSGKMNEGDYDMMAIRANQGDREAQQTLLTLATEGVMRNGLDSGFSQKQADMATESSAAISRNHDTTGDLMPGVVNAWRSSFSGQGAGDVRTQIDAERASTTANFEQPDLVRTQNATVQTLQEQQTNLRTQGADTQARVENMRVISDSMPGAAHVAGESARDSDIEMLREQRLPEIRETLRREREKEAAE